MGFFGILLNKRGYCVSNKNSKKEANRSGVRNKHEKKKEKWLGRTIAGLLIGLILTTIFSPFLLELRNAVTSGIHPSLKYTVHKVKVLNETGDRDAAGYQLSYGVGKSKLNTYGPHLKITFKTSAGKITSPSYIYTMPLKEDSEDDIGKVEKYDLKMSKGKKTSEVRMIFNQFDSKDYCETYLALKDKHTDSYVIKLLLLRADELPMYSQIYSEPSEEARKKRIQIRSFEPKIFKGDLKIRTFTKSQLDKLDASSIDNGDGEIVNNRAIYLENIKYIENDLAN